MTLREFKEQINWFGEKFDDVPVLIDSYVSEEPIYKPTTVMAQVKFDKSIIRIGVDIEEAE